ncbi:AraC family transcriptional regulator [Cohnella hashimotonis]|uniref:AraC family transcriptional regulator n=1 Tax=Cohnella hashimotonis TaxID=2826895 RepID=A0ABT6TE80_9BACL|nr:AraC family transcriptional regulator [Cohnella hashimotonis]MDI4645138.1 AraC family transcriptional regulator [Cohnella hashimotonis]
MSSPSASLIETIELKNHYSLNYLSRHPDYFYFHAHQGMELLYVHQGSGQAIVGDQLVQVAEGSLLLFQPYQLHRIHMNAETAYVRTVLVVDPAVMDAQLASFPSLNRFFRQLWQGDLVIQHIALGEHAAEAELLLAHGAAAMRQAGDQSERQTEEWTLLFVGLLQLLRRLYTAAGGQVSGPDAPLRNLRYAEKSMQWIESHFQEAFDLSRMAEALFVSPAHLSRLFHLETGTTLTDYLKARRLREACLLLAATSLPVRDVARRIGLTNVPYFAKLFKKHVGVTPLQYRISRRT